MGYLGPDDDFDWQDSYALTTGTKEQQDYYKNLFNKNNNMKVEGEDRYFTAKDARRVSDETNQQLQNNELDAIYKEINDARFRGQHSVKFIDRKFMDRTILFLKEKGFKVDHFTGCQWDPANDTTISW